MQGLPKLATMRKENRALTPPKSARTRFEKIVGNKGATRLSGTRESFPRYPGALHEVNLGRDVFMSVTPEGKLYVWTPVARKWYGPGRQNNLIQAMRASVEAANKTVSRSGAESRAGDIFSSIFGGGAQKAWVPPDQVGQLVNYSPEAHTYMPPTLQLISPSETILDPRQSSIIFPSVSSQGVLEELPSNLDAMYGTKRKTQFLVAFEKSMRAQLQRLKY